MIVYRAKNDKLPVYKKGETHTKKEWLALRNLTEKEFVTLVKSDFDILDSEAELTRNSNEKGECISITISPKQGAFSDESANNLVKLINNLLKEFNK
jgi:hypothetical protein